MQSLSNNEKFQAGLLEVPLSYALLSSSHSRHHQVETGSASSLSSLSSSSPQPTTKLRLFKVIEAAVNRIEPNGRLYIQLLPLEEIEPKPSEGESNNIQNSTTKVEASSDTSSNPQAVDLTLSLKDVEAALTLCYEHSLELSLTLDVVVFPPFPVPNYVPRQQLKDISVLLGPNTCPFLETISSTNEKREQAGLNTLQYISLNASADPVKIQPYNLHKDWLEYPETVLGGTFDRLHNGHKIMLTIAVLVTIRRIEIGVTGDALLKNKKFGALVQPYQVRHDTVLHFLRIINPFIQYDTICIEDPYGHTLVSNRMQAIIVSEETIAGANDINQKRVANGLPPLVIIIIGLLKSPSSLGDGKLSSTALRGHAASAQ
jgi:phosphopantetheine adenylyltransferase